MEQPRLHTRSFTVSLGRRFFGFLLNMESKMPLPRKQISSNMLRLGREEYVKNYRAGAYGDAQEIDGYKVEFIPQHGALNLLIWNPIQPCVQLILHEGDTTASLDWVGYDPKCTTDGKMEQGTGTKKMIRFAFRLAKERGTTHIELMDDAKVMCKGKNMRLGPMYFLKYGMTWYEKYFGFQPREPYRKEYEDAKRRRLELLDPVFLSKQPCEYFDMKVVGELFRTIKLDHYYLMSWVKEL